MVRVQAAGALGEQLLTASVEHVVVRLVRLVHPLGRGRIERIHVAQHPAVVPDQVHVLPRCVFPREAATPLAGVGSQRRDPLPGSSLPQHRRDPPQLGRLPAAHDLAHRRHQRDTRGLKRDRDVLRGHIRERVGQDNRHVHRHLVRVDFRRGDAQLDADVGLSRRDGNCQQQEQCRIADPSRHLFTLHVSH